MVLTSLLQNAAFQEFLKKNSILSQLFKLPENYGSLEALGSLQTRESLDNLLTAKFAGGGLHPGQYIGNQVNEARASLNKLKEKFPNGLGNSSDIEMPENFKPNYQRTRSFFQRIEIGTNFQTQKISGYFPVTTDLALTFGYKLNDKSTIGVGAAYKVGLGSGIQKIKLSGEGGALRSFIDLKLKGSFWITGGFEQNYIKGLNDATTSRDVSLWKQSALLGLTKKISFGKKKDSKVQLLYDFLNNKNQIQTPPITFRIGYNIN